MIKKLCMTVVLAALALVGGSAAARELTPADLEHLLTPVASRAAGVDLEEVISHLPRSKRDPMWPYYAFLRAEALWALDQRWRADGIYREVIEHAASDPYGDDWGGTALVPFCLDRWLSLRREGGEVDRGEFERVSKWADRLLLQRLPRSAFETHVILPDLPLLEDDVHHGLAMVALRAGLPDRAAQYYLEYLSHLRRLDFEVEGTELHENAIRQRVATPDRIALFIARRLLSVDRGSRGARAAIRYLTEAYEHSSGDARLEAQMLGAEASMRLQGWDRDSVATSFLEVHRHASRTALAEEALYRHATVFEKDPATYLEKLYEFIERYPSGVRTEEALYRLARAYQIWDEDPVAGPDWFDRSQEWYRKLREYDGRDRRDSAALLPALDLVWRGAPGDLDSAGAILEEYVALHPDGPYMPMARFWIGRIAEDQGDEEDAANAFDACFRSQPFGYYGIRAALHLTEGADARSHLLLRDEVTRGFLRETYEQDAPPEPSSGVYARRLRMSLDSGLYQAALRSEEMLRQRSGTARIPELEFQDLEDLGLLTRVAVMIALRQDALAAAAVQGYSPGRIAVAGMVGREAADWPLAMTLVHEGAVARPSDDRDLMSTPGYLRVAYPVVHADAMRDVADRSGVPPGLVYATVRNESFFHPAALSRSNALGLFQFTPIAFAECIRTGLIDLANTDDARRSFLLDARQSLELGARWLAAKLEVEAFGESLLLAAWAHHSGDRKVKDWVEVWSRRPGWFDASGKDIEMLVETFRMQDFDPETHDYGGIEARGFARSILTDLAIVDALELYERR